MLLYDIKLILGLKQLEDLKIAISLNAGVIKRFLLYSMVLLVTINSRTFTSILLALLSD